MHLNALLDLDVVEVESHDEINIMLELKAPGREGDRKRQPGALQIVLDRSGSMAGDRLEAAQRALDSVITRLAPEDSFGLVTFDDTVQIPVPAEPLSNKPHVRALIAGLEPGGMTNLSSGLVRGLEEARRSKNGGAATLLLLSDGLANSGVTDHTRLEQLAATGQQRGVSTSTIGIGLGYDEELLGALARGGAGNTHFAEDGDQAGAALADEVGDLLDQVAQAASLTVRASDEVESIRLYNDLATAPLSGGFVAELGDFYADEERRVVMAVSVPAKAGLGLAQVCEIELRWTDADTLESHTVTVPLHVNVVPGDQVANRISDPTVRTEVAFQVAQGAKREATAALREGRVDAAAALFDDARAHMDAAACSAPADMRTEADAEAAMLRDLSQRARQEDAQFVSKLSEADRARKSRRRR